MTDMLINTYNDVDFNQAYVADPVIDLTDAYVRMMVRKDAQAATVYLDLDSYNTGIYLNDPVNGGYTIRILQKRLAAISVGSYVFSIIALIGGAKFSIGRGTLINNAGPTRF